MLHCMHMSIYGMAEIFTALNFHEFRDRIPIRENKLVKLLFFYISINSDNSPNSWKIKCENPVFKVFAKISAYTVRWAVTSVLFIKFLDGLVVYSHGLYKTLG